MLEINGTRGRVWIEDTVRKYSFNAAGSEVGETWQAGYFNDYDREFLKTFDTHVEAMLMALRKHEPPPVPAEAGRRALRLANAAIESMRTGRQVVTS